MILEPLLLTLRLAGLTAILLLVIAIPIAWWLSTTRSRMRVFVEAVTALPLVLPPTVLGFYLLILFSPESGFGSLWLQVTGDTLAFSFEGLVIASIIYSLPFAVQPLTTAFESVPIAVKELSDTYGLSGWQRLWRVTLPLSKRGLIIAFVMAFAHTLGEFGVVLMVGGNIPGETRLISLALYEQVETLNYNAAHQIAGLLLVVSLVVLIPVYAMQKKALIRG